MAFSSGQCIITLKDLLNRVSEIDILTRYFNIKKLPCVINSPLREDKRPSFSIYIKDSKVRYLDFSTGEKGNLWNLLGELWHTDFYNTIVTVYKDFSLNNRTLFLQPKVKPKTTIVSYSETVIKCRVREWREYDLEYWESFGISKKWLEYAEIYPISHKIIIKDTKKYTFRADKYAYAYVEHKEGNTTLKIYQPFSKRWKWSNKHDRSVISLWTKVPYKGNKICICSSLKDALCLWANTNIPSIAIQGEGYSMSDTAINELKKRYNKVYILLDNDEVGLKDGERLAKETGFINIVLPQFNGGKDISDLIKTTGKDNFLKTILPLFNN